MQRHILILPFVLFSYFGYSQSSKKLDSLIIRDAQITDSLLTVRKNIDSLLNDLNAHNLEQIIVQSELDKLKEENKILRSIMLKHVRQVDSMRLEDILLAHILTDTFEISILRTGYYRILQPIKLKSNTNVQEWLYVDENKEIRIFNTDNQDFCLKKMRFKKNSVKIHKQLKKKNVKFKFLYDRCFDLFTTEFPTYKKNRISLIKNYSSNILRDELYHYDNFVRRVIIDSSNKVSNFEYEYIGN